MAQPDKIVLVTKKTPLEELVVRFQTAPQARFYIERSGQSFKRFDEFHDRYEAALDVLRLTVPDGVRLQEIDRSFLPNFVFGDDDIVATLGPDGLVVNAAKYLRNQPIIAFNPDPARIDGVLAPFSVDHAHAIWRDAMLGKLKIRQLTMAEATLNDQQALLAVNDLFIGQKTHVSARYQIRYRGRSESHSSSGVIVSTGAGSTGWYRSIVTGAVGVASTVADVPPGPPAYAWPADAPELRFTVREPFESKASQASICAGQINQGEVLQIVSQMPQNGVIFSDGVEEDFLTFNSGSIATIGIAARSVQLATK